MNTRLKTILIIGVVVAALGLYGPSLHNPPFFDDKNFFERGLLETIFLDGFVFGARWLPYFSMAWVNLLFEDSILAQRSVSLAIHLLTAFVLYSLVKQVSNHVAPHQRNERAAFAAVLLFVLHPLAVYAVGYMIQRTILMATLFGLLSLSAYFDGLVTRTPAADRRIIHVALTAAGRTHFEQLAVDHEDRVNQLFGGLSGADLTALEDLLHRMTRTTDKAAR